jgi:alanyl-tRNA synthetase
MPSRKLSGSDVRRMFLDFFVSKGHKEVHSSSLVPQNDPTLLFTNAGMNQFKDVFLGVEKRDYVRATTSQKCVRAGGKHNDLENVGFTNRHHTFFEMLGNFSFGDYFKKEAIAYAWELVTSPQWFGIPKDKLYATIFKGEEGIPRDDEAYEHWRAVLEKDGVPLERIHEFGMKDNFWMMGDTGPCGPCSELHYDMGPAASDAGHTDCKFGCECGRYVELWNLVFMQFDKQPDGKLTPLPKPSIDTGAGLERVTAVMQDVVSNYSTDLFTPLIHRAAELVTGTELPLVPDEEIGGMWTMELDPSHPALRVIADHSRAATFLINDGVVPGNGRREYVLRKILRRGIYYGRKLGQEQPFMYQMADAVCDVMEKAYPELLENISRIKKTILSEEEKFARTLAVGLPRLEAEFRSRESWESLEAVIRSHEKELEEHEQSVIDWVNEDLAAENTRSPQFESRLKELQQYHSVDDTEFFTSLIKDALPRSAWPNLSGVAAFRLYETYGLPRDFIEDVALSHVYILDEEGFEKARSEEQARARASWKGGAKATASPLYQALPRTEFEGYRQTLSTGCEVLAIIKSPQRANGGRAGDPGTGVGAQELKPGEHGEIVLDHTPFYAEAGGQVGDVGWLYADDHNTLVAEVEGVTYPVQGVRAHRVVAKQAIHVGDKVDAIVNDEVRRATMRNHTGTHLLHAALREVLGKHVKQAGSLVDPAHLRFDFSHFASVGDEELQDIEDLANKEVLRNDRVEEISDVPIDVAINEYHAMALFGEKYGDRVRVIRIGDFSTELCGGTHTAATGEIGLIKVLKEGSVSSGVRRLEAITGEGSLRHFRKDHELENVVSTLVRGGDDQSPAEALRQELDRREEELKKLRKELEQARMKSASTSVQSAADNVREVKGVKVLATRADNLERAQLRVLIDNLRTKLGSGVVVLGSVSDGKVALIVGVTKDLTARVQAGKVIAEVAKKVGGSGGGRPDMAEAGGKDPAALDAALADSYRVVEGLLS